MDIKIGSGQSGLDSRYVNVTGDTMTGDLIGLGMSGTSISGTNLYSNEVSVITSGSNLGAGETIFSGKNNSNLEFKTVTGIGTVSVITNGNIVEVSGIPASSFETPTTTTDYGIMSWSGTSAEGIRNNNVTIVDDGNSLIATSLSGTNISGQNIYRQGTEINSLYVNTSGDTMTGDLVLDNSELFLSGNSVRITAPTPAAQLEITSDQIWLRDDGDDQYIYMDINDGASGKIYIQAGDELYIDSDLVTVRSDIIPSPSGTYDLGSLGKPWGQIYANEIVDTSGSSIYVEKAGDTMTGPLTGTTSSFSEVSLTTTSTNNTSAVRYDQMTSLVGGLNWQESVIDKTLTTAPVSPTGNDRHIIAGIGGDWSAGTINDIAEWDGSIWAYTTPVEGFTCWVTSVDTNYTYNGSTWVEFGSTVNHNNLTGLQGGTTSEYYHLTQTQHTGTVGMNTAGLPNLTSVEVDQLKNINTETISNTQWGYLGASDQGIATTNDVTFNSVTAGGISGTNVSGGTIYENGTDINDVFVNATGDTITGDITLDTANILNSTSGVNNLGSAPLPFDGVYSDDVYATGITTQNVTVTNELLMGSGANIVADVSGTNSIGSVASPFSGTYTSTINDAVVAYTAFMEEPTGDVDGVNTTYTLLNAPYNNSLHLFNNGLLLLASGLHSTTFDYTLSGTTVEMIDAPASGSTLIAGSYTYEG